MRIGLIGTGAIADKHAEAYRSLGFRIVACSNRSEGSGQAFAQRWGCEFRPDFRDICSDTNIDFVDVCTYPNFRLPIVEECTRARKAMLVEKPLATTSEAGQRILDLVRSSGITFGVISQRRFDDAVLFLKRAIDGGRLGRLLQADAYVKWFRSEEYYARPGKGTWEVEGGGALINQAIHQLDLLRFLAGEVASVGAQWALGARHAIEAEDVVNALLCFGSGASGNIQASTAFWPGQTERIEIHGTRGTAILSGDRLTTWDVLQDEAAQENDPAPVGSDVASGASDPLAIRLVGFERQFADFARAVQSGTQPLVDCTEGFRSLCVVQAIYTACREHRFVQLTV